MRKLVKIFISLGCVFFSIIPTYALDDGAYLTGRLTSYVSPFTGSTVDGGENVALGDSMISSMVESTMLIEKSGEHIYATIGIGLQSQISNVRFQLMNSDGSSYSQSATVTGTSTYNGDSVKHYRMELNSLSQWISPVIYVTPMGRDVQFFIQSDQNLKSGSGIYKSEMVTTSANQTVDSTSQEPSSLEKSQTEKESKILTEEKKVESSDEKANEMVKQTWTKEQLFDGVTGLSIHEIKETTSMNTAVIYVVGGVCLVILIGGLYVKKKIKR